MRALLVVLGLIDRVLQLLVPSAPNRIVYASIPDFTENAYYVFRHALRTRDGLEHVWLIRDGSQRKRIEQGFADLTRDTGVRGNTLRIERQSSITGYLLYLRSRWVFHTHGLYRFRRWAWHRHIVSVWHGMPIKCIGLLNPVPAQDEPAFGTLHLATSEFFRKIISASFGVDGAKVTLCSLPRCDALQYAGSVQCVPGEVRERLGLPADHRLVLWLPTHRILGSHGGKATRTFLDDLPKETLAALENAADRHRCTIVVKLHPLDPLNTNPPEWNCPHIRLLRSSEWTDVNVQLYDLIAASDMLLSDISSVLIDYLVTDRQAGIVGFDPTRYARGLNFPIQQLLETGRVQLLDSGSLDNFFGRSTPPIPKDVTFLYQKFERPGSEQILLEVGL